MKKALTRQTGLTTSKKAREYFIGKKFKITKGSRLGEIITVNQINFGTPIYVYSEEYGTNVSFHDTWLEEIPTTKKELEENLSLLKKEREEKIKEYDSKINDCILRINYIKETKSKTFDEQEFKAYSTLTLVENDNLTKLEKAKLIAALIN